MNRQMFRVSFSIIISGLVFTNLAWANSPKIDIVFSDPAGICKDGENKTQFAFNYSYKTDKDFEYYSGPVYVSSSFQSISAPLPPQKESIYTLFEVTDSGMCGQRDLNYANRGDCYKVNLIPQDKQGQSHSYKIFLTPHIMPDQPYGQSYNLICKLVIEQRS
jgi:hypothetical protein